MSELYTSGVVYTSVAALMGWQTRGMRTSALTAQDTRGMHIFTTTSQLLRDYMFMYKRLRFDDVTYPVVCFSNVENKT